MKKIKKIKKNHSAVFKGLFFLTLVSLLFSFSTSCRAAEDYFFLIDVSGSLVGLPRGSGNQNVWAPLKDLIGAKVDAVPTSESRIIIAPFDSGIRNNLFKEFQITSPEDRINVKNYLNQNLPTRDVDFGPETLLINAVGQAMEYLKKYQTTPEHKQSLLIFSDAKSTEKGTITWEQIKKQYKIEEAEATGNLYIWAAAPTGGISYPTPVKVDNFSEVIITLVSGQDLKNIRYEKEVKFNLKSVKVSGLTAGSISVKAENFKNTQTGTSITSVPITPNTIKIPDDLNQDTGKEFSLVISDKSTVLDGDYSGELFFNVSSGGITLADSSKSIPLTFSLQEIKLISGSGNLGVVKGKKTVLFKVAAENLRNPKKFIVELPSTEAVSFDFQPKEFTLESSGTQQIKLTATGLKQIEKITAQLLIKDQSETPEMSKPLVIPVTIDTVSPPKPPYLLIFAGIVLIVLVACFLWFKKFKPQFSASAELILKSAQGMDLTSFPLKQIQKKSMFKTSLTIGNADDDIDIQANYNSAKVKPGWGGNCYLVPFGEPVKVNKEVINEPMLLVDGMKIEIGNKTIKYRE